MIPGTPHSWADLFRWRGLKTLGVFTRPAGPSRKRFPAVLLLHGIPGAEKNVDIQRRLMDAGVAGFALHFAGAWGSEGEYRFSNLVPQARAALRFLARQEFVDERRLAVFGFSMGGWTALNVAAAEPRLRAVAAVAPVGGPETLGGGVAERVERLSRPLRVRSVAALARDYAVAVTENDPARAVAARCCPLLLVHGDADDVVPVAISRRLFALANGPKRLVIEPGACHDFLDRREKLSRVVADWLAARLS